MKKDKNGVRKRKLIYFVVCYFKNLTQKPSARNTDGFNFRIYNRIMKRSLLYIIFILSQTLNVLANSGANQLVFNRFPFAQKLPTNAVEHIFNDSEGFIWFCTIDGLCRFDGYDIKVFRSSSSNPNRLTNNSIECLAEDKDHRLWIGTMEGVNILDKRNYAITPYHHPALTNERIKSIAVDPIGNVWIATNSNGMVRISPDGSSRQYFNSPKDRKSIPCNNITSIHIDRVGKIWIMFWRKGMAIYNSKTDRFDQLPPIGPSDTPFRILQDKDHDYMVATWGDGLFSMDPSLLPGNPYKPITILKDGKPQTINGIGFSLEQDDQKGNFWVVTYSGLTVLEKIDKSTFRLIDSKSMFKGSISNLFHQIYKDRQGSLWLGSARDGVFRLDFRKPTILSHTLDELEKEFGFQPDVSRLCETSDSLIYLGVNRSGLYLLNPKTGSIKRPDNPIAKQSTSISSITRIKYSHEIWFTTEGFGDIFIISDKSAATNSYKQITIDKQHTELYVRRFMEDRKGNVWIGTDLGLYKKNANEAQIHLVTDKIKRITTIDEDKKGNIWIGSDKQGAAKIALNKGSIKLHYFNKSIGNLLSNSIRSICCRQNGEVCIGTQEGSLYLYNEQAGTLKDVSRISGIIEESVLNILEDKSGSLIISTVRKIIKYNPEKNIAKYYTYNDGIEINSFSQDACAKLQNGDIMFGGDNGICIFTSNKEISKRVSHQKVSITNIEVQNQNIFGISNDRHFDVEKKRLTLSHSEDILSLEFSALNYFASDKIQYAYRLIGIDNDWIFAGNNRRFVNYSNLPGGKYTFQVKASDENGLWSDQVTTLEIIKHPPLYQSWWAYTIYLLLIALAGYVAFMRIRLKNELKISRIDQEKSEELTQTKLRYFTNITHDLLTPLTIIGLLTKELGDNMGDRQNRIQLINSNISRLKRLIEQVLAFRKTESGNMKLQVLQADVVEFVREVCYSNFQPLIKEKNIDFSFNCDRPHMLGYIDMDKIDKVMYNLLSNAFKFTPIGGKIEVNVDFPSKNESIWMNVSVRDSGIGISKKDLPLIFTRFYISNQSDQSQSHGIGLSLTKDLVELHKGEIRVASEPDEGAEFGIEIPIAKAAYTSEEIATDTTLAVTESTETTESIEHSSEEVEIEVNDPSAMRFHLLIVEDNIELRNIIERSFANDFDVSVADNGVEALSIIQESEIDLIISDVMMPDMDGLTLCRKVKSDIQTSHITLLLLTAKSDADDQVDYYNAGADAFIAKPFDIKVLEARVNNLIQKREKQAKSFRANKDLPISSLEYSSLDEEFLKKAISVVEKNMSDFTFDSNKLAGIMNCSNSTLYRKLKSLTGFSPSEFFRHLQMKHACIILENTTNQVSEIAYQIGLEPKYFSRCFKAEFNMTPTEYRETKKNKS